MDRNLLHRIADHVRLPVPGATTRAARLVDAVRLLAKRYVNNAQPRMYGVIAKDMPAIAQRLGFNDFDQYSDIGEIAAAIETISKDIRRSRHVRLVPAFVSWMWQQDTDYTRRFLQEIGFDLEHSQKDEAPADDAGVSGIQHSSAYTLERVLAMARSRVILVAQNHWHMVAAQDRDGFRYWPLIVDALTRGVDIEIVAMHHLVGPLGRQRAGHEPATHPDAVTLWSLYCTAPLFSRQLDDFWTAMGEWDRLYRALQPKDEARLGNLTMLGAYFTPLTMTVIDPDEADATLVVSPRTPDPKSTIRPQFVARKIVNPDTFAYYYGDIAHALSDHHWVKMFG